MTNQIKYLLVPLALSVLVGCGEPEADASGTDNTEANNSVTVAPEADTSETNKPASVNTAYAEILSRPVPSPNDDESWEEFRDVLKSACQAIQQAGPGSQRAVLSDHGFSEPQIEYIKKWMDWDYLHKVRTTTCQGQLGGAVSSVNGWKQDQKANNHATVLPQNDSEREEWFEGACIAMREAGPGSMRAALRDHGMEDGFIEWLVKNDDEKEYKQVNERDVGMCGATIHLVYESWRRLNSLNS